MLSKEIGSVAAEIFTGAPTNQRFIRINHALASVWSARNFSEFLGCMDKNRPNSHMEET